MLISMFSKIVVVVLATFWQCVNAYPSYVNCDPDASTSLKIGTTIMGKITTPATAGITLDIQSLGGQPSTVSTYTPGVGVRITLQNLPNGSHYIIRAGNLTGSFYNLTSNQHITTNCTAPAQVLWRHVLYLTCCVIIAHVFRRDYWISDGLELRVPKYFDLCIPCDT